MSRWLPSLNALRAFEAAARHLSFTKAAEELHVTPAAISHQIKVLEEQLGVTIRHFAYPNGLWDDRVEILVKQVYKSARHFKCYGHADYITNETDLFRLPTMNVNYLLPFEDFKRLVNRTDPEYCYYKESEIIGHAGSNN